MQPRSPWAPLSLPLALSVALGASACRAPGADGGDAGAPAAARLDVPVDRPDVALTDVATGRPFDLLAETEGQALLLFFGYTSCPDVCPVQMASLAAALRTLTRDVTGRVRVVFVTTDPERDTPERLASWLGALHPGFVGLRGTREEVTALERSLGLPASIVDPDGGPDGGYFVGHASQVLAFGPDGPARVAYPWGTRQRDWVDDLPRLVSGELPPGAPVPDRAAPEG